MKIGLFEPQIPPNTGNIVRLSAAVGMELYLIGELGFSIADKDLKRAGLDYWKMAHVQQLSGLNDLERTNPEARLVFISTHGEKYHYNYSFKETDILVFGSEIKGLPAKVLSENKENVLRIPMHKNIRCLNLATSVGIVVYEAVRQLNLIPPR